MTPLNLNYLFSGLTSKYSHWGLGLRHINLGAQFSS